MLVSQEALCAPQQRPNARCEFLEDEGLGDIVISAGLQASNNVMRVVTSRDNNDRDSAHLPNLVTEVETAHSRQHDINKHEVGGLGLETVQAELGVLDSVDRVTLIAEGQPQR